MWIWRSFTSIVVVFLLALPMALPVAEALQYLPLDYEPGDLDRIYHLSANTLFLVLGTLIVALPVGTSLAILLIRTDLPLNSLLLLVVGLAAFVPIPVLTSCWHAVFGGQMELPVWLWPPRTSQPWPEGLAPAIWVHGLAAIPWVALLMGLGLANVETELEEAALQAAHPLRVMFSVVLLRTRPVIFLTALWIAVRTAGDIGVTDMFLVRTMAEEVYLLLNLGSGDSVARVLLLYSPVLIAMALLLARWFPRLNQSSWPTMNHIRRARRYALGRMKWPAFVLVLVVCALVLGVPIMSMIWRTGVLTRESSWSLNYFSTGMAKAIQVSSATVIATLLQAVVVGLLTACLTLVVCLCWLPEQQSKRKWNWLYILVALLWVVPGPVAGIGLKNLIQILVDSTNSQIVADALYFGPSPLPSAWAWLLRAFPFAVVILWPMLKTIPKDLRDAARLAGANPLQELLRLILPLALPWLGAATLVVTALALDEISASKHVATPGTESFCQVLFQRMHTGVTQDVSSLCLLLLTILMVAGLEIWLRGTTRHFAKNSARGNATASSNSALRATASVNSI